MRFFVDKNFNKNRNENLFFALEEKRKTLRKGGYVSKKPLREFLLTEYFLGSRIDVYVKNVVLKITHSFAPSF